MRHISEVNDEFRVHENPICLIDAVKSIDKSYLLANIVTGNDGRLTEQNLGTIIRNSSYNVNLDLSNCVDKEMDGYPIRAAKPRSSSFNT